MTTSTAFNPETCPYVASAETTLRCAKCSRPLMVKDAKRTPVGYVCPFYVRGRVATFYNAGPETYGLAAVVALVTGVVCGGLFSLISSLPLVGLWIMILGGPAIGGAAAEVIRRALNRKRGRYIWLVSAIAVSLGVLLALAGPGLILRGNLGALGGNLFALIGLVLMLSTLVYRLRM